MGIHRPLQQEDGFPGINHLGLGQQQPEHLAHLVLGLGESTGVALTVFHWLPTFFEAWFPTEGTLLLLGANRGKVRFLGGFCVLLLPADVDLWLGGVSDEGDEPLSADGTMVHFLLSKSPKQRDPNTCHNKSPSNERALDTQEIKDCLGIQIGRAHV